ncbi:hypothetical protein [Pseudonocardia kunmingensis]|nr:hypothetical protein [Pseudonocardia kunmingensis]
MKHVATLVVGMLLLVLAVQGAIRLVVDHTDAGLLAWMPGGFGVWLLCYAVLTVAGALLAARGSARAKRAGGGG